MSNILNRLRALITPWRVDVETHYALELATEKIDNIVLQEEVDSLRSDLEKAIEEISRHICACRRMGIPCCEGFARLNECTHDRAATSLRSLRKEQP
jgi:hypothetical protein